MMLFLLPLLVYGQGKYPLSAKKLFKQAQDEYLKGNSEEALNLYTKCINEEPSFCEAYLNMSIIAYKNKSYDKALSYGQTALIYNKVQAPIYSQIGKTHFMLTNYDSCSYYLNLAVLFGATSETDYFYLAISESNQDNYEKTKEFISNSIRLNNTKSEYYTVRGDANFGLADYESAKVDYEKSLALNPKNNSIYKNLANVYIALENPEKALENINKGIASASGDDKVSFLILQGNYYHEKGELDSAEKSFNEAFALNQSNPIVLTNQAAVLIDRSDFEGAIEKCTEAIDLDGSQTEAYFNRGIAYEMLRKTEEACSDWEEAFIMGAIKAEDYLNSPTCNE